MSTRINPIADAVREIARTPDLLALADIEGAISVLRAPGNTLRLEDGALLPGGGDGTPHPDADWEYRQAVNMAVSERIFEELEARGFREGYEMEGQLYCPEADR